MVKAGLKTYKDGNKWCILVGDNIQEGFCGFGDTIDEALYQFLIDVIEHQKYQPVAQKRYGQIEIWVLRIHKNTGVTLTLMMYRNRKIFLQDGKSTSWWIVQNKKFVR